ncbi:MAG: hypothetical protein BACD_00121 [Bacteroides rodentium]
MWATDAYGSLGEKYYRNEEITTDLITGYNSGVIKTRARKAMEQQSERTKAHAEVFTPLWVCNMMNNHIDEVWFERKEVFNRPVGEEGSREYEPTERIDFKKDSDWKKYIDSRRLEITCGEAPYLVSRYDVETGEYIPIPRRIGILDRKLRVVNENAKDEKEWYKWAVRALQATYGYEFQGDNVLIARVNMLMTFDDYLKERWDRRLKPDEQKKLINIITWNIWQMDGLSGTIPYSQAQEHYQQMTLFELFGGQQEQGEVNSQPLCRIYDWRGDYSLEYLSLQRKEQRQ